MTACLVDMEQDLLVLAPPLRFHVLSLPFVEKLWSKNRFNQRSEKMQKQRKIVKGDQIIIM